MLELAKINEIATKAAASILEPHGALIHEVKVEPTVDHDGREVLNVTLVIARGTYDKVADGDSLDTLVAVNQRLRAANEDRFASVRWTTEEELEEVGDSEC